ncbi:hypothetical protein QUG98_16225 [Curtobacterium sp. RHCJP20]|uniref:Uncharacterized protein n=1 Tax=Curtobacterium subtropicum TaxID=3055138 RepID=A0ABT7TKA2_9MICO|nr:hypothetical protein [Curtobacterium subtropicum]MDM7890000.1 hypothetical protein [Curtobacterium subtropicum]
MFFVGLFVLVLALLVLLTPFGKTATAGRFPVRALNVLMLVGVAHLWFKAARALIRRRQ